MSDSGKGLVAAIDESRGDSGVYSLAAYFSTENRWAKFTEEWQEYLPHASIQKDGTYQFKMSEMHLSPDRASQVKWFERIIGRHVLFSIAIVFSETDLQLVRSSIFVPGVELDFGYLEYPYLFAMKALMDSYLGRRDDFRKMANERGFSLAFSETVRFVFDDNNDKATFLREWGAYYSSLSSDAKSLLAGKPEFRSDNEFLPLQAVDSLAWSTRMQHEGHDIDAIVARELDASKHTPLFVVKWNRDQIKSEFVRALRTLIRSDTVVYWNNGSTSKL